MACESEPKATYVRLDSTLLDRIDHYAYCLAARATGIPPNAERCDPDLTVQSVRGRGGELIMGRCRPVSDQ